VIIQALCDYYERKMIDPDSGMAPLGLEQKEIKFVIEIDEEGKFLNLKDMREGEKGRIYLLPQSEKRSGINSWQKPFLLWDHYGFVLGQPKKEDSEAERKKSIKQNSKFIERIKSLPDNIKSDRGVHAVIAFYEKGEMEKVKKHPNWESCIKIPGCNLTFQLSDESCLVPEHKSIREYSKKIVSQSSSSKEGCCLATGKKKKIQRLHSSTFIPGSKTTAKLVGCQRKCGFDSYHKEQAFNAPMCAEAENAYTTALNYLTRSEDSKVFIGDTTTVFWSERKTSNGFDLESNFPWYFVDPPKDDPDRGVRAVKALFNSFYTGKLSNDKENRFYVLGLSPNAARISVRYWKVDTTDSLSLRIKQHFDDLSLIKGPMDPEYLNLNQLLCSIVFKFKKENIPPNLAGNVVKSILDGRPYPETLLQQCLRRIRAERKVSYKQASILKACLNRKYRYYNIGKKEVTMALDMTNQNPAYLLGRLFAVLEKIQEEANPGINSTIRDSFYGAASSTPVTVFPRLLKLKNHHLSKFESYGHRVYFEKQIGQIMEGLSIFPKHQSFDDQAQFAIGYYHQRQDYYHKK
jgi:CRISPR-associated protein Csd1